MTPRTIQQIVYGHEGSVRIKMSDGDAFTVQAQHLMVLTTGIFLGLDPDPHGLPRRSKHLNIRQITQVDLVPKSAEETSSTLDRP